MKHKFLLIFLLIFSLFLACKNEKKPKDFVLQGTVFGTTYKIAYRNASKNYQKQIDSLFYLINKSMSTYLPTSTISKINNGNTTINVDDFFVEVFKKSKRIYTETNGFFDPTVGNLVNAYGFGPKNEINNLSDDEVARQMQFVGLHKVRIINKKVVKENSEIYLDFNSIAKGFGIDVVARFFNNKNIKNYLIEIGGEIRAKGVKKNKKPWIIQLVNPVKKEAKEGFRKLNLSNKSMATSGNYRKFRVTKDGEKYVHTINPKTGLAEESNLLSASVIAALDCADVDAYATAFMAMGLEKTKTFLQKHPQLKVILIYENKEGNLTEYTN